MYFLQAAEDEHLSAPVRRVYFPFSSLSVTATLGHNSLVARHWMDKVSKGLQLALGQAGESKSEAPRYEAERKKRKGKKQSSQADRSQLGSLWNCGRLQTAAEVFN